MRRQPAYTILSTLLLAVLLIPSPARVRAETAPAGDLWAWGGNFTGQFGNGTVENSPTPIPLTHTSGILAFGAVWATVVVKDDGTVWAWGYNRNGELANPIADICPDGARPCSKVPVQVPGLNDVVAIDVGAYHTLAQKRDGTLWGWGYNGYGALGSITGEICSADVMCSSIPVQVPGISGLTAFAAGHAHSLALRNDGTVWSWGANYLGQLGRSSTSTCQYGLPCSPTPAQIDGLSDIVAIFAGKGDQADHSFALQRDGTVWAWGMNDHGELGVATSDTCSVYGVPYRCSPRPVRVSGLSGVTSLAAGAFHSLALTNDGRVWSWGDNTYGQLGRGSISSDPTPRPIADISGVVQIAAGTIFNMARKSDGTVWAWGDNSYGQLGDNSFTTRNIPVQVQGLSDVRAIAAGGYHGMAIVHVTPPPPPLVIVTESPLPNGTVGAPYSAILEATGGTPPYIWGIASGSLPSGLTLDPTTGEISGVPTAAGTYGFTIQVADSSSNATTKSFGLAPPPPSGSTGAEYTVPIHIDPSPPDGGSNSGGGDTATCTNYTVVSGTLPAGLTLDPATGVVSGTPLNGGTYNFTIGCTVSGGPTSGQTATKDFTITIFNVAPTITSFSTTSMLVGPLAFGSSSVNGSFTDPGTLDTHTVVISWGDGSANTTLNLAANILTFSAAHQYTSAGCKAVSVTVTDDDTGSATATTTASVGTGEFLAPMTNQPVTDKLRNNQVLPVKVRITDCNGNPATNLTPAIRLVEGDQTLVADDGSDTITPPSVSAADTSGYMRFVDGSYIYNMKVSLAKLNTDYTVIIYPYANQATGSLNPSVTLRHVIQATK